MLQRKGGATIYIEVRGNQAFSPITPYYLHVSYMDLQGSDHGMVAPGTRMPMFGQGLPTGSPKTPGMAFFYLDSDDPKNLLGSTPVLPDGRISSSIGIPGSLSGKHSIITNVMVGDQIVAASPSDIIAEIAPIRLDCWVDDAWMKTSEGKKPIVNKLVPKQYKLFGETVVDLVCDVDVQTYAESSALVQIQVEGNAFGAPYKAYVRNSFGASLSEIPFIDDGGGKYHVELTGLSIGVKKQVVFRFHIPYTLPTPDIIDVKAGCYEPDMTPIIQLGVPRKIRLLDGIATVVFTTRTTLFRDHDEDEVAHLLGQVYIHSQDAGKFSPRDRTSVIYYADHYRNESIVIDWDNTVVDYSSETNANKAATYIRWVMWDRFDDSETLDPSFLLLIGNDEQFPMYRMLDPYHDEHTWDDNFPGGDKGNPAIECCLENYFLTDDFYAYLPNGSVTGGWKDGNVDLRIGRIIGDSAADMEQLYLLGHTEQGDTGRAIMASVDGWELGYEHDDGRAGEIADFIDVPARLASKGISVKNDAETPRTIDVMTPYPANWATSFQSAANAGMDLFFIGGHNSYTAATIPQDSFNPADIPGKYTRFDDDNPIVMIVGCHGGLPVPNVGWAGGVNSSMVYNVIHNGARAYFGASGFSYGSPGKLHKCLWGELYLQYVFYHFIKGAGSSYTLGTGVRNAKNYYPFGIGSDNNLDRKTVTEFNLFGVPWQILNYPSGGGGKSRAQETKDAMPKPLALEKMLMRLPRKVAKMSAEIYEQQFIVDTPSWDSDTLESFDIINIPAGVQQYIPDDPLLPALTSYSIALPPGGTILNITADDYTTQTIGTFNIPTVKVVAWSEGGITLTGDTEIDYFYPPQIVYAHEGSPSHYLFTVFPIRHNPTTDDTVLHDHVRITIQYEAPVPFGILNFAPDAAIFSSSEIPAFKADIFNMGDADLDLSGLLSIVEADTLTTVTETGMNLHILSGTIYPVSSSAGAPLAQGHYIARLKVSQQGGYEVRAESEFSVNTAYLSNLSAIYLLDTNEASISLNAANLTDNAGSLNLAFNITQGEDLPVDTVFIAPLLLNPASSQPISDVWTPDIGASGTFTVEAVATFEGMPLNSLKTTFRIYTHESLLQALLDHLLARKSLPITDRDVADFNKDGILDIGDVVAIIENMP